MSSKGKNQCFGCIVLSGHNLGRKPLVVMDWRFVGDNEQVSPSFLKKRSKRLLPLRQLADIGHGGCGEK
jgi:hypothetical protein